MRKPRAITLSTDIGSAYAAQMKAVLASRAPAAVVIDLSHDLRPHAIGEAAFLVRAMARGFPAGTVHVVVVDPGVGGRRAPIVIATRDGSRLVGPDNGVLAPLAEALGGGIAYRLAGHRRRVGTTFDGRDVFAPAAATLARGVPPARLGTRHEPLRFRLPAPVRTRNGARGTVLLKDRFGNLITSIPTEWLPSNLRRLSWSAGAGPTRRLPFVPSYEALGRGRSGVLGSSFGLLEIAVAEGSAAERFRLDTGARVRFAWPARLNR